jgi:hypothetical protein
VVYIDLLGSRLEDLVPVNQSVKDFPVTLNYSPISFGKLRLWMQFSAAMFTLRQMGFTEKDIDELKGIFADTNIVLLCVTFVVAALHVSLNHRCVQKIQIVLIYCTTSFFRRCCLTFWLSKTTFTFGVIAIIWSVSRLALFFGELSVSLSSSFI